MVETTKRRGEVVLLGKMLLIRVRVLLFELVFQNENISRKLKFH